jgi:hypothetical protein
MRIKTTLGRSVLFAGDGSELSMPTVTMISQTDILTTAKNPLLIPTPLYPSVPLHTVRDQQIQLEGHAVFTPPTPRIAASGSQHF